jgi:ornithine carbamoyltransferase
MPGWTTETEWPPDLLNSADVTHAGLGELLELAAAIKAEPPAWSAALAGETLVCFIDPPTIGMSVSAAAAAQGLGMTPVVLPRDELRPAAHETLGDVVRTFSAAATVLLAHGFPHRRLREIAAAAPVPVVNTASDRQRPCQALADLLTIQEHCGRLEGLALAYVGDGGDPIAHSLMEAGALAGMDVRVACPPELPPDDVIEFAARTEADLHGGRLTVTDHPEHAVAGAHAVYTSAWVPPGREAEREARTELLRRYRVHPGLMKHATHRALFLHSLPARRDEEVSEHVIDGARSVVWEQVANRVPAEQAVVYALVGAARGG